MRKFTKYPSSYVRAGIFSDGWYFGKDEAELCGDAIRALCDGWIISKRATHCDAEEDFSLVGVANLIQKTYPDLFNSTYTVRGEEEDFGWWTILGALEGMCHNNKACEVADGFYYVGNHGDWTRDKEAHARLEELENF